MPAIALRPRAARRQRNGFNLTELLLLVVGIAVVGGFALPALLRNRIELNEEFAVRYLRQIDSVQALWRLHQNRSASLLEMCTRPIPREDARREVAPALGLAWRDVFDYEESRTVMRGGYLFRDGTRDRVVQGIWAWPSLEDYSGEAVFWLDYADRAVYRVDAEYSSLRKAPPEGPPDRALLEPVP